MASIKQRPDGQWRARYRDDAGKEHARHFARKVDARRWLDEITTSQVSGTYVDPRSGRVTFREYAEAWRVAQPHRPGTQELVERQLRRYIYPVLGDRPMSSVRHSDVQAFVTGLGQQLRPDTVRVVYSRLVGVFGAAVRDRIIPSSPCDRIALPERHRREVEPLSAQSIQALRDALPARYSAIVIAAAGLGLRHAELTGLTVDRVDFLRHRVTVDRQLVTVSGRAPYLGPPKSARSRRVVPLPEVVALTLAEHIRVYPPGPDGLIFTTEAGRPLHRATMSTIWSQAVARAGLPKGTRLHDLRHTYASLLIRAGESVVVVCERLGHANAGITLGVYAHLFPDDDQRTRRAIDGLLGGLGPAPAADSVRTAD